MTEQEVFVLSEQYLKSVIDQIQDDKWQLTVDKRVSAYRPVITLRALVNYHAYDDSWVADTLAGKTIDEVGDTYRGDLLGDNPKQAYDEINTKSQETVRYFTDLDKIVHLTYGDFPAREYLKHTATYRGFQGWAIARFLGIDDTMPVELVEGLSAVIMPSMNDWRAMGVFAPEVAVPEGADNQTELLCKTGFYYPR